MKSVKFDAGKYYIGDPCYVIDGVSDWNRLLEESDYFNCSRDGEWSGTYKGYPILIGTTGYGDGVYYDNYGRGYGVDAGVIGIIDIKALDLEGVNIEELGGHIIEFNKSFMGYIVERGKFIFGGIVINTYSGEEYDDYDEDG